MHRSSRSFLQGLLALALTLVTSQASAQPAPPEQPDMTVDAATRTAVIEGSIKSLNDAYVFPETAKKMEKAIRERVKRKEYDGITSADALAEKLTTDLREVSKDKHLRVIYRHEALPADFDSEEPTEAQLEEQRRFGRRINHGFEKVERLPGNIGYLAFRGFFDPALAGETAAAAMGFLGNTDALIIDLRENGGGDPAMVALMCSYLFDKPTHLNDIYSRPENTTQQYWTLPWVPGPRYVGRDVYVLTSGYTFSGAEEFTYNLKNLKRATIIGETTGGGAHPVQAKRLNDHFFIGVPFARAINPITKTNWEGTGVAPDVATPADQALVTAQLMALRKLKDRAEPPVKAGMERRIQELDQELETLKKNGATRPQAAK